MAFADLNIPGVAGSVSTEFVFWSGYRFRVGGERVKPHGFPRNRLTLPGTDGPVEAKVKGGLFRAHPALVVGGTEFSTGGPTSRFQQAFALLPLAGLLLIQGALGFLVTFSGIVINMGIVRSERSNLAKIGLMVATLVAVVVIDLVIAIAIVSTLDT